MRTADLLLEPPYNFKGVDNYQGQTARELKFILNNDLRCPVCKRPTPMSYSRCNKCGADMGIDKFTMERVIKTMMY